MWKNARQTAANASKKERKKKQAKKQYMRVLSLVEGIDTIWIVKA